MKLELQLDEGFKVTQRTEVGEIRRDLFSVRVKTIPRMGEFFKHELPSGLKPREVRGRVKDVAHFPRRAGFWAFFDPRNRSSVTVVLELAA